MDANKLIELLAEHFERNKTVEIDFRKLRKAKRLTQQEAGDLAGVSRKYIGQIEQGNYYSVSLKNLQKILDVYGKELVIAVKDK